jgi:hypothetical protein
MLVGCCKEVKLPIDTAGINLKESEAKQVPTELTSETTPKNEEYTSFWSKKCFLDMSYFNLVMVTGSLCGLITICYFISNDNSYLSSVLKAAGREH